MNDNTSIVVSIAILCTLIAVIILGALFYNGYKQRHPQRQPTAKVRITCVEGPLLDCRISR